jgi:branched-chain amino acid aminotransferase
MATKYAHHKVWLNGEIVDPEDAKISVFTATAMRGANVYEGLRAYWNEDQGNLFVWKLDQHIERLFQNMKIMRITPPFTVGEYHRGVLDWARENGFREDVHFRLVTYFGDGGPGDLKKYKPDDIEFGAWIAGGPRKHDEALEKGIHVGISSWRRINDDSMPARVKAGSNYQNSRLAGVEAQVNGYDDALILTRDGKLAEAPGANVMLVRDGELITPSVTSGILEGITRATLMELFRKHRNREARERDVDRTELYVADEIFICGSAEEVTPVVSVDRIPVGDERPGPITQQLQEVYFQAARGRDPDYTDALTPVY